MHVSSKDSSKDGREHILTSVIEADGPMELCAPDAQLSVEPVSVSRTASGGIEVSVRVKIAVGE